MASPRGRARGADQAALELARQLASLLSELGLGEIEVSVGDLRVRLARQVSGPGAAPAAATPGPEAATNATPAHLVPVEAPMVGTFYRASSPSAEPYVHEGDLVKEGQILCIIEAMKLMNEIEAKIAGRIAKIFPENAQPVEYGQPLFLIDRGR
jgi:biotin carboxyl carrier protein